MSAQKLARLPAYLTWVAAIYALLGGLLSFAGWATGTYRLTDWVGGGITMKVNASLAAAAAGAALLLRFSRHPGSRPIVRALAVLVAAVGGLTLVQHVFGWDFGIDTLLLDEPPGAAATAAPGRMGPPASISFLALGIALVLLTCGAPARRFSAALGLAVLAIGMLSLVGHWYGAERMYTIPRLTGIAAQTATIIVALGIGVIASNPDRQPMRTLIESSFAGQLARRLVPLVIGVPLVLGWIRIQGQQLDLYDAAFGTAIRTIVEVILFSAFVWWSIRAIQERDLQRRRAEDDLRLSEQRLGQTLASITDGFVTLDREWRFTFVNPEAERFLGRPASALLGRAAWSVLPEHVGSRLYEQLHRAMDEGMMVEVESAQDGRYFNNRIFPAADRGVSVYIQDVTVAKEAQDALREADRRKDEFIATLAHELRNPLAPISNAARLLEAKAPAEPTIAWATEVIGRQVRHMARLLEDLLDVSRITLNRLELRRQWMDLTETVRGVTEASRPNIDAAGHELIVDLPDEPVFIDGDAVRLSQVLANLLTNAARYTERGGHIRVAVHCEGTEVLLRVGDDGIGISQDMLPRVFEMFVQGRSQHVEGGLGIGLWLAKAVVERHDGRIEARSAGSGAGSEFVVRLPLLAGLVKGTETASGCVPPDVLSRRVLVVDDLEDSADTLALLLDSLGHDVETAYGGEEALHVGSGFRPEVIFLDIGMPDVDGFEACRRIRRTAWGRDIRIFALTGWGQPEDRRRTEEAGFDLHLIKPVDPDTLSSLFDGLPKARSAAAR